MKLTDFEDFLREKHAEQYIGLDDDMCDDESEWIANLDVDELIVYGEEWGNIKYRYGVEASIDKLTQSK